MSEPMNLTVEVWPVVADEAGLWLVSGDDAWRFGPVPADSDVHYEVEFLMADHGVTGQDVAAVHSTSWRPDGPSVVLTYMAAVKADGFALDRWPGALPITPELAEAVGRPPTHAANEAPVPRYVDVALHGLRHLAYLIDHDRTNADAMGDLWRQHLAPFEPAMAGMYSEPHKAA